MTLVNAEGKIVTLSNKEVDPERKDMFWALCGGGGGNFGITVEVKVQAHRLNNRKGTVVCDMTITTISRDS
jgi:FAD/FMN-containing dehydrogenase